MSFAERFEVGLKVLRKAQYERAWALVTGVPATIVAAFISMHVASSVQLPLGADQVIAIAWASAATIGSISLLYVGVASDPSRCAFNLSVAGLWIGNICYAGTIAVSPLAMPIGAVFVIGGLMTVRNQGSWYAAGYVLLPTIALLGTVLFHQFIDVSWYS